MTHPALRLDETGERLRLLHVHAHPDDESSKGAATTAKYVAEGVDVWVATCTGGERGDILNPAMDRPDVLANIAEIRKQEMDSAREILGIHQVWLGFVDSGLPEGDPLPPLPDGCFGLVDFDVAVEALVKVVREFRPHVMTTYDENGGYPHPDHVRCHQISVAAFEAAGKDGAYPDAGPIWQPSKLYYHMWSRARYEALNAAMVERGAEPPYADRLKRSDRDRSNRDRSNRDKADRDKANRDKADRDKADRVTTRVNCADYFAVRDRALIAHATQIDPEGHWFAVPLEVHQQAWPTEDYELVTSKVETTVPEDDLFAGIPTQPGPGVTSNS